MAVAAMMLLQGILGAMAAIPVLAPATAEVDGSSSWKLPAAPQEGPPPESGPPAPMSRWLTPSFVPMELWISDQSIFLSPANISVAVGGIEVVNGSFPVGSQHNYSGFHLTVSSGVVDAYESTTGARGHFEAFRNGTNVVVVSFWWYPDQNQGPAFAFSECACID
jgi:hypothetical protein